MLVELNYKNSKDIKHLCKVHKMDINTVIEELIDHKNRLQYEIIQKNSRIDNIEYAMQEIAETNTTITEGTVVDEYYELQKEKDNLKIEVNLLNYLFKELI